MTVVLLREYEDNCGQTDSGKGGEGRPGGGGGDEARLWEERPVGLKCRIN